MLSQDRILIVDDNPTNVALLEDILEEDYDLQTAASGEEALDIATVFHPSLILLDIMMPGINGYETCRRMRQQPILRHAKILMVSAKAMVTERLQGYEAGADDYITKPFNEDELLAKVRVYLRLKSVEELDRLKSDLLRFLSHEMRTPLNGILPVLSMLMLEEQMHAEERRSWLHTACQSAERLLSLFDKAISLCAMRSGTYAFHFAPADLRSVVQDAVCASMTRALARNVRVDQILPEQANTRLDQARMTEVLASMLDNAVCFSPPDETVVVEVSHDDSSFYLSVTNQSTGIHPDTLSHLFEEFSQTDVRHHTEGQRLSLAVAQQVVLAHNGTISVESTKDSGTIFTIRLPADTREDSEADMLYVGSVEQPSR